MKKNKKTIAMLSVSIVGIGVMVNMNTKIKNLRKELDDKNIKIEKIEFKNNNLLSQNKELLNKNQKLLNENKELNYRINDLSFNKVVFNPNNITTPSKLGSKQLEILFNINDKYEALKGLEVSFIKAEREHGINAIFLLGLVSQESNYSKSNRAKNNNNLTGYAVYSPKSKGRLFSSRHESIMSTAKLLKNRYIKNSLLSIEDIGKVYCPNDEWANPITKIANTYVSEINDLFK